MKNIIPFFELTGQRYEITKTRWLLAEYDKMAKAITQSEEERQNAIKASNLIEDVKKYADKTKEFWDKFCENPTEENKQTYLMFKSMSDTAIDEYNAIMLKINGVSKETIDILEKVAIKGLAEQYFDFNEEKAKEIWEKYVEKLGNNATVEWLLGMRECLFGEDDEVEENSFLAQMRKRAEEKANNRKNGMKKR